MKERLELCREMERNVRERVSAEGHGPLLELVNEDRARGWLAIVSEVPTEKLIKCIALVISRIIATSSSAPIVHGTADAVRHRLFCEPLTEPVPPRYEPSSPNSARSTSSDAASDDGEPNWRLV